MRENAVLLLVLVLLTASAAVVFLPVEAVSKTIVVPDDYPTISSAIGNATAGDTIFVKKGTYEEQTLTITKTLSVIGEDVNNTKINLYPPYNETWILTTPFFDYSNAITITANDVRLSNLTLAIAAPGGYISATGDRIQVTGNSISTGPETGLSISGSHCNITDNTSDGLIILSGSSNIITRNAVSTISIVGNSNTVSNNTCWNLRLSNARENVVSGNRIASSRSRSGISLTYSNNNLLYRNYVSGFIYDIELWFSSDNTITANTIADSLAASISFGGSSNNTIYLNNFVDNMDNLIPYVYDQYTDHWIREANPDMTASTNSWDNGKEGNHWDNYNGTDNNRDGIGDTPYILNGDNIDNYPLMEPYDVERGAVALPPPEQLPTIMIVAAAATAVAIGAGALIYFKKRRR